MKRLKEIQGIAISVETDFAKFYDDNNKAAGTRARKALLEIEKQAKQLRKEIMAEKKLRETSKK